MKFPRVPNNSFVLNPFFPTNSTPDEVQFSTQFKHPPLYLHAPSRFQGDGLINTWTMIYYSNTRDNSYSTLLLSQYIVESIFVVDFYTKSTHNLAHGRYRNGEFSCLIAN